MKALHKSDSAHMIVLTDVKRVYRTQDIETSALGGVNVHIGEGEFVAIMGPSGCGKSTLLSIMGMLDEPTSGSYLFEGNEMANSSERKLSAVRQASIGFVFQSFNLIDDLTVYENVELPLQYLKFSAKERKKRVSDILNRMAIDHRANHFPKQLSGGQQQRVAVARALVINPKLILADEPTGNLDSKNGEEVMHMLQEVHREGATIVMVTHSEKESAYADRIIRLLDGQVISTALTSSRLEGI